ncbi:hypothetical protein PVL29_002624 [Vitis rotundifolia]|uniref:RRM domain-containing protein n=1 Tax=Vitis rotundifolia TaxID=103349 RepID=A0AA39AIF6_VITRO|nr:hypothetical protein PVL29_002624 [Vitis rotundifolia]
MGLPRFSRPKGVDGELSPNLYVANCGPAVGLSFDTITSVFSTFGEVKGVYPADDSGARVIVSYFEESAAQAALKTLDGHPCPALGGRFLHIRYSIFQPPSQVNDSVPVSLVDSELNIPGIYLLHDFVSAKEEEELLAAVDKMSWKSLSKRRVQHYGYEFCYETRNVNTKQYLGELPSFVSAIVERISSFPNLESAADIVLDQLTCGISSQKLKFFKKGYLSSSRSMLLLSGEARYAWHHYIPHHKIDMVKDSVIRRGPRRVSFTFRKVRTGPCQCEFPQYCDSPR